MHESKNHITLTIANSQRCNLLGLILLAILLLSPSLSTADERRDRTAPTAEPSLADEQFSDLDLDNLVSGMPTIEEFGYYLSEMDEWEKSQALGVLADLASDPHLDPALVAVALRRLLAETGPPTGLGYCRTCFGRQLSGALQPLRLRGPRTEPPEEGIVAIRINERFLERLRPQALDEVGGTVPGLIQALLDGWPIAGKFERGTFVRYHSKRGDTHREPAFFSSADALQRHEVTLERSIDDRALSRWLCQPGPKHRFEPGFLLLYFDPSESVKEVRIPTAADSEAANFRPSPLSETRSGRSCGGAPEWASENIPLSAFTRARYVPNRAYLDDY
jgi:hypothetical protein